jgi:two-component system, cell cycle sensor histidine kinase and response regulator CckA
VISGYSQVLQSNLSPADPTRIKLEEIYKASQRAASLTRQLLAFSRKQNIQPVVLDLNSVLNDTCKMLRHVVGENTYLSFMPQANSAKVKADRGQIEQILMNLVVNARDAMPNGGKLIITTATAELDQPYIRDHRFAKPGRHVMLSVSDTGTGMDKETQTHIFEPFFTTKDPGKGTGLGLSTVYGIVKQHGGHIIVYSELGLGTTFKVYFPEVDGALTSGNIPKPHYVLPTGNETILVVEDEDSLRKLTYNSLQSSGYTVLDAREGKEALEIAKQYNNPIHLLLTDVIMPGVSGRELADTLSGSRPEMKVLYMSGYSDDHIAHHGVLERGVALIEKPFSLESLLTKVREVLDSRANAASAP